MSQNASIALLSVGHSCVDVYQGAVAALVPFLVAERGYGYAAVSGVVLAASLLSSVAQPLFGALTDRWPLPWLLPVSTLLGGAGIALSGVGGSYGLTLAWVALSGVGVAAYHPESARVARAVAGSGGSGHRGMAWFSLGGNLGFAAAPLLVAAVVGLGGLRLTPLLALPALAGAALCLPVLRELARRRAAGAGTAPRTGQDDRTSFVKLSLAVVCRSIVFTGLSTFLSLYAAQRLGGGTAAGTAALVVLYAGGAVGSLLGGALAERWGRVAVARSSYLVAAVAVAGVLVVPGPGLYVCVALTSAGLYVPFSLQVTLGQDYLPSRIGTASGITLGLTVSVGGLASPVIGSLADATSLRTALVPLVAMPLLSWALFRTLPEPVVPGEEPPAAAVVPGAPKEEPPTEGAVNAGT
ncbi:MFS transporter [Streptomyces sp. CBMA123]|uniref:MFS transporter n=1 Tax=Streptomyces sp. CBMA123 TaxID=1896313 RepID=UPI0016621BBE|nr:MFS transporter [Streptomyces sp. CBMA123]MBD0693042.1 MFS transporter [Streptomyces sp. CBMA123]